MLVRGAETALATWLNPRGSTAVAQPPWLNRRGLRFAPATLGFHYITPSGYSTALLKIFSYPEGLAPLGHSGWATQRSSNYRSGRRCALQLVQRRWMP